MYAQYLEAGNERGAQSLPTSSRGSLTLSSPSVGLRAAVRAGQLISRKSNGPNLPSDARDKVLAWAARESSSMSRLALGA